MRIWTCAAILSLVALTACGPEDTTYTLYRNSVGFGTERVHVATFDALDGADYNRDNCNIASRLFAAQPFVQVRYWCEKGRYRR